MAQDNRGGAAEEGGARALLSYGDGQFFQRGSVGPGPADHVICAHTGRRVHLTQLRYWSVARQEAYVDGAASLEAEQKARGQ